MMEDTFWPIPAGSEGLLKVELYRGYKKLINIIAEKLRKGEVLSLAYQHDLPAWFVEVGPMHEPGYALRVLSQMEGRQIFSPTNLKELTQSLETIGRCDLGNMVKTFEDQHRDAMDTVTSVLHPTSLTPEPFTRDEPRRMSLGNNRRYLQDTFREEKNSQSSLDMQPFMISRPVSENSRSRHGSWDKCSLDRSREGTPFETVLDNNIEAPLPQDVHLGIEMSKMSAETLGNQLQLVQQMLLNHTLGNSPSVHHSLTNAYLLTKQITSLLNIASDSIKMVPVVTRYPGGSGTSYGDETASMHRYNSYGEMTKHHSQGSLVGGITTGNISQPSANTWDQPTVTDMHSTAATTMPPTGYHMYRTHSQPQVFHMSSTESSIKDGGQSCSQGDRSNGINSAGNQFSPLEFTDVAFGDSSTTERDHGTSVQDVPPPLPPRPSHMVTPREDCIVRPIRISPQSVRAFDVSNQEEAISPITKHGYHLMRPSKSVQDINNLNNTSSNDNLTSPAETRTSKSLSRSGVTPRGLKLLVKKKIKSDS